MRLVSFWYDKTESSDPKLRFVLTNDDCDNIYPEYIRGYDMLDDDRTYKSFKRSKIDGSMADWGVIAGNHSQDFSVLHINSLLEELNYTEHDRAILVEFGDYNKIELLYEQKTGIPVTPLTSGYYFVPGPRKLSYQLITGSGVIDVVISEGVVEYFVDSNKITTLQFTRLLLGIKD